MKPELIAHLQDFEFFAENFLKIRSKSGQIKPFIMNRAQRHIHNCLERQLKEIGMVRAVVLKGRQQGCSTLIEGRFTQKTVIRKGTKTYILTHEQEATNNLFEMTRRYIDYMPEGLIPKPDALAATKLHFKALDSGYAVGTAGNKGAGRSSTIQLFHGSEVAFWPHAEEHAKGVMQAVSREKGTEIILESTANGIGNYFYNIWHSAMSSESEYQAIFVPWYWQDEYSHHMEGFEPTSEENELLQQYGEDGLTNDHLIWRRLKIAEFSKDWELGLEQFKQEYPMTAAEAFRNPIENAFLSSLYVMRARKNQVETESALSIGVDPAISDKDACTIVRRRGRRAYKLEKFYNHNTMQIAGRVAKVIDEEKPAHVYIDMIGIGAGVVDRLLELGYDMVQGINVANRASNREKYKNKRAELWGEGRDWLMQDMPVEIPDDDGLHGALCNIGYKFNSNNQLQLESKDDLRKRGLPSPDEADALMLTFAGGFYDVAQPDIYTPPPPTREDGMFY